MVDQLIVAASIAYNFTLTTVDDDLVDFIKQEFSGHTISPLGIINEWIEKGLLMWDDEMQAVIEDWEKCNEYPRPQKRNKDIWKNIML